MNAYCKFHGIGLIPWCALHGGTLARPLGAETTRTIAAKGTSFERSTTASDDVIVTRVEELAKKHGKSMAQVALAWVSGKVTSPIIGVTTVKRLEESWIKDFQLTMEEVAYLEEL